MCHIVLDLLQHQRASSCGPRHAWWSSVVARLDGAYLVPAHPRGAREEAGAVDRHAGLEQEGVPGDGVCGGGGGGRQVPERGKAGASRSVKRDRGGGGRQADNQNQPAFFESGGLNINVRETHHIS